MKARLLLNERHQLRADAFVSLRVWAVPEAVRGSAHVYKYSLAFVVGAVCVLRFDNEAGKGDHKHVGATEAPLSLHDTRPTSERFLARGGSMEAGMKTVTLSVASREAVNQRFAAAFEGEEQSDHISFASVELLWQTLTKKRWDILQAMTGAGALSIRAVARRVGRDVKAVHGDVTALLQAGVIDRTADGVVFPYDAVHVAFALGKTLKPEAA
jgi:predicted transcriptional regulator